MADTSDTRSRPSTPQERREGTARTPRLMRRDLFDLPSNRLFRRMQDNLDRFFGGGHDWNDVFGDRGRLDWTPAIETFQRGNDFVVRAELPGMSRQDVSVEVGDEALTISGERTYDHDEEHEGIYRSERAYGAFKRIVSLPEGALAESAKATFKDGVLEVRLQAPSPAVRQGRRLEISEDTSESSSKG
jgi:HSP20 family protein